jgi:hypothetical protein
MSLKRSGVSQPTRCESPGRDIILVANASLKQAGVSLNYRLPPYPATGRVAKCSRASQLTNMEGV